VLSLLVSIAPRWAKYVFVFAFVYVSFSTNPSRTGLAALADLATAMGRIGGGLS
jgi:hypothetical protein